MALSSQPLPTLGVANATEDAKIRSLLAELQGIVNGGVDASNAPAMEYAFSSYKDLKSSGGSFAAPASGFFVLGSTGSAIANVIAAGDALFYLDPADYAAGTRTVKGRLRTSLYTNTTAPAITFTLGLYPVVAVGAGVGFTSVTLGTVVSGSTVVHTTPGAASLNQVVGGDFVLPAAGHYVLGLATSGSAAANSQITMNARLQVRQV